MEWTQYIALIATIIGGGFTFYQMTQREVSIIREQINIMNVQHREDIQRMDDKWERLFERLLLQDKKV